ncbi:MAG: hypothetical protein KAR21_24255 [Spirochaetales bacterium]|nr:hypothetical protein [Spirochaetales bacterium]
MSKINEKNQIIIEPISPPKKYDIHDLVKKINPEQKQSEVDWGKPEGKEIRRFENGF